VTELLRDDLHRHARLERQARCGVPQVVQSDGRRAGGFGHPLEGVLRRVTHHEVVTTAPLADIAAEVLRIAAKL
jgi:hypothetical protein